jgi:hypothetical protein
VKLSAKYRVRRGVTFDVVEVLIGSYYSVLGRHFQDEMAFLSRTGVEAE